MKKPPLSSEQLPDSMAPPRPDSKAADASVPLLLDSSDTASATPPKPVLVDSGKGSFNLFADTSQSAPDELRPEGVGASIPLVYRPLPPKSNLEVVSPATVPVQTGLVYMLSAYPRNLPSTSEVPVELANRLLIEVADHLDCNRQVEVSLADVNEQWLASFQQYLETFYVPERVAQYLTAIRLLVARNGDNPENSKQ